MFEHKHTRASERCRNMQKICPRNVCERKRLRKREAWRGKGGSWKNEKGREGGRERERVQDRKEERQKVESSPGTGNKQSTRKTSKGWARDEWPREGKGESDRPEPCGSGMNAPKTATGLHTAFAPFALPCGVRSSRYSSFQTPRSAERIRPAAAGGRHVTITTYMCAL
eukprot:6212103-Pleurochrysis_carterae.AAC.2